MIEESTCGVAGCGIWDEHGHLSAPEDVDPKALAVANTMAGLPHEGVDGPAGACTSLCGEGLACDCDRQDRVRELARAITALLREREKLAYGSGRDEMEGNIQRQVVLIEEAEAKLRERDEEIERLRSLLAEVIEPGSIGGSRG